MKGQVSMVGDRCVPITSLAFVFCLDRSYQYAGWTHASRCHHLAVQEVFVQDRGQFLTSVGCQGLGKKKGECLNMVIKEKFESAM